MTDTDTPRARPARLGRTARVYRWIHAQRRAIAGHMLRGLCYGAGTGAAGLLTLWAEHHL
ncbi:hypothetical protein ABZY02_32985 [Streptomyces sp. NPDC006649]|uniref:hypothetical protein n=1 Tax=Streptomyces sp. NPDC006649 TaxID=3156896 RepID=UPI00339DCDE7